MISKDNTTKIYYFLIIIFAFTLPLSKAITSFCILCLFIIWILEKSFKKKFRQILSSKILISIIIFYIVIFLSSLYSQNLQLSFDILKLYTYWFIVLIVIATSIKKENINMIITSFLLGMFISEIVVYGTYFNLWMIGNATKEYLSPFMYHIEYSVFLSFTSILLLNKLFDDKYTNIQKFSIFIFFLSTTINLFISIGRTGQVSLIFAIIILFIYKYKIKVKTIIYILLSLFIIYFLAYKLSTTFQVRIENAKNDMINLKKGNYNSSIGIRVAYWIVTWDILKENPLFGVGIGDYKEAIKKTLSKSKFNYLQNIKQFMVSNHLHNQFLMILVQLGILGLLLTLYIFYCCFKLFFKIQNEEHKTILLLFLVIFILSCFTEPLWNKRFSLFLWILIIGIFSTYDINKKIDSK